MKFFRNMPLKLLALVFAMALWFHVATNQRYDLEVDYKVKYVNIPPALAISEAPDQDVAVLLRGSGKGLMRLMWGERYWPVDLSRARTGRQQIHILTDNVPLYGIKDLEVLGFVEDDTLTVTLDSLAHKTVPVRSAVIVETSEGFTCATDPVLTPDSAQLSGPRSSLATVDEVWTQPEMIENVRDPVERLLSLLPVSAYGVSSSVQQIRVYQKVEPFLTRSFAAVPVTLRGQGGVSGIAIRPDRVAVEITGPQSAMTQLVADSIIVACDPLLPSDSRLSMRPHVAVPAPMRVLKLSPDSVTVERRERTRADTGD